MLFTYWALRGFTAAVGFVLLYLVLGITAVWIVLVVFAVMVLIVVLAFTKGFVTALFNGVSVSVEHHYEVEKQRRHSRKVWESWTLESSAPPWESWRWEKKKGGSHKVELGIHRRGPGSHKSGGHRRT